MELGYPASNYSQSDDLSSHAFDKDASIARRVRLLPYHIFKNVYNQATFHLSSKYCQRMQEVFDESNLDLEELKTLSLEVAARNLRKHHHHHGHGRPHHHLHESNSVPSQQQSQHVRTTRPQPTRGLTLLTPAMHDFKQSWEGCVSAFLKDWETSNLICVLLLR